MAAVQAATKNSFANKQTTSWGTYQTRANTWRTHWDESCRIIQRCERRTFTTESSSYICLVCVSLDEMSYWPFSAEVCPHWNKSTWVTQTNKLLQSSNFLLTPSRSTPLLLLLSLSSFSTSWAAVYAPIRSSKKRPLPSVPPPPLSRPTAIVWPELVTSTRLRLLL